MLGGLGSTTKDIPPFVLQQGYNCVTGLNTIGLRRAGIPAESIAALREAFRILYKEGRAQGMALDRIEADLGTVPEVAGVRLVHPRGDARDQPGEGRETASAGLAEGWHVPCKMRSLGKTPSGTRCPSTSRGGLVSPRGLVDP